MTDEEVNAYALKIEEVSLNEVRNVLPSLDTYNVDIAISKICDVLAENINVLRKLNSESENNDLSSEILDLLKKYYICTHYLDEQNDIKHNSNKGYRIIFAKTPAGNPYFKIDFDKVSREAYGEVKDTLDDILNGVNMSDDTKVKYYSGSNYPQKVLAFKGFQVRIYTTKLKGNILCVVGLEIKKDDWDKKISDKLRKRLSTARKQIEQLRRDMCDDTKRKELLSDSGKILNDIMYVLQKEKVSNDVEYLFPSDEELEAMVPYFDEDYIKDVDTVTDVDFGNKETIIASLGDVKVEKDDKPKGIPNTSKKVKRRGRGLGKKTILRNEISDSLKGLSLEELMEIQNFITKIKMDKGLNESIGNIYEGFLNMTDDQIRGFEENIKYFKHDGIKKRK